MENGFISYPHVSFQNQRIPADIVLLRTTEKNGETIKKIYLWAKAPPINDLHHPVTIIIVHGNSIFRLMFCEN